MYEAAWVVARACPFEFASFFIVEEVTPEELGELAMIDQLGVLYYLAVPGILRLSVARSVCLLDLGVSERERLD